MDIRREIANKRLSRIEKEGYGLSVNVPPRREFPLNDFSKGPFVICEVKRGSPSKGHFAEGLNAVEQAELYENSGVRHVSVLTEEDRFFGSLKDIMDIKRKCPTLPVLRKDFLLDLKDVETSYLCGADAYLLITSLLDKKLLTSMYNLGVKLGMTPLVEIHDKDDVEKLKDLKPKLVGINSRDLKTFTIDPLRPLKIRSYIDWECDVVYESGIKSKIDAEFVRDACFSGVLVGEWAVKVKNLANELVGVFKCDKKNPTWKRLFNKYDRNRPFVKICGLTNIEDVNLAKDLGASMLGFILAPSPRKVDTDFIKSLKNVKDVLKVGVVVLKQGEKLPADIKYLVENSYLDFIQFHGDESYEDCIKQDVPFYKALRIKSVDTIKNMDKFGVVSLIDSFSETELGGTGKTIDKNLTIRAREYPNLWLAGGLNPENIKSIVLDYRPELIDVSSGLELKPGKKDVVKMKKFFKELK